MGWIKSRVSLKARVFLFQYQNKFPNKSTNRELHIQAIVYLTNTSFLVLMVEKCIYFLLGETINCVEQHLGRDWDQPLGHCQWEHIVFLFSLLWNREVLLLTPHSSHFHN